MRVGALSYKIKKTDVKLSSFSIIPSIQFSNTVTSGWPLRWRTQCSWRWVGFPRALWTSLGTCLLCHHSWNLSHSVPVWCVCRSLWSTEEQEKVFTECTTTKSTFYTAGSISVTSVYWWISVAVTNVEAPWNKLLHSTYSAMSLLTGD